MPDYTEIEKRGRLRTCIADLKVLYETALEIRAKAIVEIGAENGGSSMVLGLVAKETGGQWAPHVQQALTLILEDSLTLVKQSESHQGVCIYEKA